MADITFKHVVKTYDKGNTVVPDLNLEIKDKSLLFWLDHPAAENQQPCV